MKQRKTRVLVAVEDSGKEITLMATMLVSLVILTAALAG